MLLFVVIVVVVVVVVCVVVVPCYCCGDCCCGCGCCGCSCAWEAVLCLACLQPAVNRQPAYRREDREVAEKIQMDVK